MHTVLVGSSATSKAAIYPAKLCRAVASAVLRSVRVERECLFSEIADVSGSFLDEDGELPDSWIGGTVEGEANEEDAKAEEDNEGTSIPETVSPRSK